VNLFELNDFELIYLIREGSERAEALLYEKYHAYIYNMILGFNVYKKYYDDFYQEGLMAISIAINTYDMDSQCSFYNYLCIVMRRRFSKYYKYVCELEIPFSTVFNGVSDETNKYNIKEEKSTYYEMGYDILKTDFDRNVYRLVYKEGYSKTMAAEILGCDVKKVYNSIQKIKGLLQELSY